MNFRLAYNDGYEYIDLFPKTNIESIEGKDKLLKYSALSIDIPVPTSSDMVQVIPITVTPSQSISMFYMELISSEEEAKDSYSTINQAEIVNQELHLTRLYGMPKSSIQVRLIFKENEA